VILIFAVILIHIDIEVGSNIASKYTWQVGSYGGLKNRFSSVDSQFAMDTNQGLDTDFYMIFIRGVGACPRDGAAVTKIQ
jgi:hypothetical protein